MYRMTHSPGLLSLARSLVAGIILGTLTACAASSPADDSLYRDLGGTPGIERVMSAVLQRIGADDRIAFLFAETDQNNLHGLLVNQLCYLSGGPCAYEGLDMEEAHSGLDLSHREFEIFVEDVILGMEDAGISYRTQTRVLAIYAPMRDDVIHH
ncbi:MAG: hypothetical protein Tsb002_23580 [Wenzhouxiangellaceae bacterium]